MTPQERQLIDELFDRLANLENQQRDPEAERAIAEGLARAPHALYPLVQTVLVQDEALRAAEERIQELEGSFEEPQQERGFLDNMRDTILGPDPNRRGSVPSVGGGGGKWNTGQVLNPQPEYQQQYQQPQYQQPQYQQPMQDQGNRGGSFLGTAAAAAAGVIGGSLLYNSLGSMFGGDKAHASQNFGGTGRDSPWGDSSARNSDLARDAGVSDIGSGERDSRQSWFDSPQNIVDDPGGDGGIDFGGNDDGSDSA